MAELIKFIYGTDAEILALTSESPNWIERAFYYPSDKTWFYQVLNGSLKKYAGSEDFGVGIKLNNEVIGGIKQLIEENETLTVPENFDYNTYNLDVEGILNVDGQINTI